MNDPTNPPPAARPSLWQRLARHWREGTLRERLEWRLLKRLPLPVRVRWSGAETPEQGAAALARWGAHLLGQAPAGGWLLLLGEGGELQQRLAQELRRAGLPFREHALAEVERFAAGEAQGLAGILCCHPDARRMTAAARALGRHPLLARVPFEYVAGLTPERAAFARRDEYADTFFVAPSLLDVPGPYAIYEESLQLFEQKCGLRDYLDLYQVLRHVVEQRVPGDIAEFGSYRGHSGWLIARTLQALGSDKRLYMFDMFEQFPPEPFGMDHYWNQSHFVDFAEVQRKMAPFANVQLVKGDFTQTLATSGVGALALGFIDCDSYRATRYLIDALWQRHLAPGSALVCEDYGHPALLGNRAAVHEELDGRPGAFRFFSQFSGLYITLKLSS